MEANQAGTKFAEQSHQKTIDLQVGIIANQQKAIDVANVRIGDLVEANANLEKTLQWYRNMRTEGMGAAARAEIAGAAVQGAGEVPRLIELLNAIKPNFGDVGSRDVDVRAQRERIEEAIAILSAAPAAPSEQAQPEQKQPQQDDFGQKVTDMIGEIRKAKTLAWRDSLVEKLIELIEPSPQQSGSIRPSAEPAWQHDAAIVAMKKAVLRNELAIIIGCVDGRTGKQKADAVMGWIENYGWPEAAKQQCISVDDRLPEAEMSVLVMAPDWERPCIAAHFPGDEMNRAEWQDDSGEEIEPPPTVWMQLPEFSAPASRVDGITSKESVSAECWSCKRQYTEEQRLDADGNCPHCGVEIEPDAPGASTEDKQ